MLAAGIAEVCTALLAVGGNSEVDAAPLKGANGIGPAGSTDATAAIVAALTLPTGGPACGVNAVRSLLCGGTTGRCEPARDNENRCEP
jgi:hypothetical protein